MEHDPYSPPTARLQEESELHLFWPVLLALLGGMASWLAALKSMRWAYQQFWLPALEAGHPIPGQLDTILAVGAVYAVFGAAIALLRAKPWWAPWLAFFVGTVTCIAARGWPFPRGMTFLGDVLLGHIFLSGVVAGSASFLLVYRYVTARSNKSLERTRAR
jgi:hypothetical protein